MSTIEYPKSKRDSEFVIRGIDGVARPVVVGGAPQGGALTAAQIAALSDADINALVAGKAHAILRAEKGALASVTQDDFLRAVAEAERVLGVRA